MALLASMAALSQISATGNPTISANGLCHNWQLHRGLHWQVEDDAIDDSSTAAIDAPTAALCPADMAEVSGAMKSDGPNCCADPSTH